MAQYRKDILQKGEVYHIYTRSIAKYVVFNNPVEFDRMLHLINLYRYANFNYKYSQFLKLTSSLQYDIIDSLRSKEDLLVEIIAYCLMPTHIHLSLKQLVEDGIARYMARVLNGYSRYFNTKHGRVGPLWFGRFKNVLVSNDEQLLHLTRYIHLNSTSANLVNKPEDWGYSSYHEYINNTDNKVRICNFKDLITIKPEDYKEFIEDRKGYQQQLSIIKSLTIDDYVG